MHAQSRIPSASHRRTAGGDHRLHADSDTRARSADACADAPMRRPKRRSGRAVLPGLVALSAIMTSGAFAEESIFAFSYTTDLLPQGGKLHLSSSRRHCLSAFHLQTAW
jgi:hypothetical protein